MVTRMFVVVEYDSGHCRLRSSTLRVGPQAQACEEGRELACKRMDRMQERGILPCPDVTSHLGGSGRRRPVHPFVGVIGYVVLGWILL
jgi:hypothetical protein